MRFEKGDSTRLLWLDPNLGYRYEGEKVTPVRMRASRPLWRDAGPLALLTDKQHGTNECKVSFRRPDAIHSAFELHKTESTLDINVYGVRTDMKMKVFEWAKTRWSIPSNLGQSSRLGHLANNEIELAAQAEFALRNGIRALYPRGGEGNKSALGTTIDRCLRSYWQHLEYKFESLLSAFSAMDPDAPDDPALIRSTAQAWRDSILYIAKKQFELAAQDLDADSDALKRQVEARGKLHARLRKVLT